MQRTTVLTQNTTINELSPELILYIASFLTNLQDLDKLANTSNTILTIMKDHRMCYKQNGAQTMGLYRDYLKAKPTILTISNQITKQTPSSLSLWCSTRYTAAAYENELFGKYYLQTCIAISMLIGVGIGAVIQASGGPEEASAIVGIGGCMASMVSTAFVMPHFFKQKVKKQTTAINELHAELDKLPIPPL
jgi:hypothetical protein